MFTGKVCSLSTIKRKLPILVWLPKYEIRFLFLDFIAGLTVALTTIPQAIAYGVVAGLEPQYGLYSAFMGCFTYVIFGSCKDVAIAATAIMALMINPYVQLNPDYAILICFLSGCIILALGMLNMGVLVQFISIPVVTAFTMAAELTIASAQINNLFGISSNSNGFIYAWKNFFMCLTSARRNDALLGVLTLCILFGMKKLEHLPWGNQTMLKYISLSKNALAVIIGTSMAYFLSRTGSDSFRVTGNITSGLPNFKWPPFATNENGNYVSFTGMVSHVGASLALIPLVAILEIVAISKAFSKGKTVDASQQMIALGLCNIFGSLFGSMPVTGSFTRTAVNNSSGVKTPLGGIVTGSIVLLALAFLTQTFYYIPKASLAAIIIAAMIQLLDFEHISGIWRSRKLDLFPFIVTCLTCLFWSLEYGIICGILVNSSFILYSSARPKMELIRQEVSGVSMAYVDVKQKLDYAAAEYVKFSIVQFLNQQNTKIELVVIHGREIHSVDYTVAMNIFYLMEELKLLNCNIICWNWNTNAYHVVCRLNHNLQDIFYFHQTMDEVIMQHLNKHNKPEKVFSHSDSINP